MCSTRVHVRLLNYYYETNLDVVLEAKHVPNSPRMSDHYPPRLSDMMKEYRNNSMI